MNDELLAAYNKIDELTVQLVAHERMAESGVYVKTAEYCAQIDERDILRTRTKALTKALEAIKAEVGTSTLAHKIAREALSSPVWKTCRLHGSYKGDHCDECVAREALSGEESP